MEAREFFPSIVKKPKRNNIREIIEKERGLVMINQCKYRADVPNLTCTLPIFSKSMSD